MSEHLLISLAAALVLGIGAQWLAWRTGLPSILLLLMTGFAAGPVLGWIEPDQLLGPWLMPLVSVSVGLILFEGGLTLKFHELKATGRVVRNLISVGALTTLMLSAGAAHWCLGWDWSLSLLMGAVLVVTGPTVIVPLLRHIQPTKSVGSVLKWEGILIDPVGAMLALLVFEAIVAGGQESVPLQALASFGRTIVLGGALGAAAAWVVWFCLRRYWVPDYLQNPAVLMVVVGVFTLSNYWQHESGLLTVTVMGVVLANQKSLNIRHIIEFKENLRVLLISLLFILLASRVDLGQLGELSWKGSLAFLGLLLVVVRPVTVAVSTLGSALRRQERLFLAWMAPRGIVAAAVASVFALRLEQAGHERAIELVPITFLVIVGTVSIYGLTAPVLAKWLGLARPNPQGILFVGANPIARALAKAVREEGYPVLLADTNWDNLSAARLDGCPTHYGNVLSESAREELELTGIGRMLAVTSNHEVNTLAALHFIEFFGRSEVYQVQVHAEEEQRGMTSTHGRMLFGQEVFYPGLLDALTNGATVRKTGLTEEFTFASWQANQGAQSVPLFVVTETGALKVFTADSQFTPVKGQLLLSLGIKASPAG